jgi:hypothetical protein
MCTGDYVAAVAAAEVLNAFGESIPGSRMIAEYSSLRGRARRV